jgi:hypothetical protein
MSTLVSMDTLGAEFEPLSTLAAEDIMRAEFEPPSNLVAVDIIGTEMEPPSNFFAPQQQQLQQHPYQLGSRPDCRQNGRLTHGLPVPGSPR